MSIQNQTPSKAGIELVRLLAAEGERIFTTARARELAPAVGMSDGYVRQALHHLTNSKWLLRLRNGLYALSSTIPGVSAVHEFEIAMALITPAAISHWSALHHHGLTEQAPRKVFVLSTTNTSLPRLRGKRAASQSGYLVAGIAYKFIQVKPERYFGVSKEWIGEARINITDPERTLLDGLAMPQYFGDFAEVLHACELHVEKLDLDRLVGYALKWDAAVAKRLGWVFEYLQIETPGIERLLEIPVKGYRTLDATGPRKGPCNRRWMIQENLPGKVLS